MKYFHDSRGVTLILAVLILTASLAVSLGIFNIIFTQLQINKAARESYKAFYSADAAKECVLYYAKRINPLKTEGFWHPQYPCNNDANCQIQCGGSTMSISNGNFTRGPLLVGGAACDGLKAKTGIPASVDIVNCREYTFSMSASPVCAAVTVDAFVVDAQEAVPGSSEIAVIVASNQGSNLCVNPLVSRILEICDSPDPSSYCPR